MFGYEVYRVLHFIGVFLVVAALAPAIFHGANGGSKQSNPWRRLIAVAHGVGLLLLLLGGFGMLAKLGLGLPGWAGAKLGLWLLLGALLPLAYRVKKGALLWGVLVVTAISAQLLGLFKPF